MKFSICLIFMFFFLASCMEKFDLQLNDNQKLIVQGVITNKVGPYLFHLSLSTSNFDTTWQSRDLNDTTIIITISDNVGNIDTLKRLNARFQINPNTGNTFVVIPNYNKTFDTVRIAGVENEEIKNVYYTTFICGQIGREYSLKISYKNEVYTAKEYMNPVPTIDSISFQGKEDVKKYGEYYVPTIYFKKPKNDINYYLFDFSSSYFSSSDLYPLLNATADNWYFSILNDEFLPNYINGFQINDGPSPKIVADFGHLQYGDQFNLKLYSLSKDAYSFYESLISQFNSDGGVFTPVPASAPTNISNGALGYFRVSALSEISVIVE